MSTVQPIIVMDHEKRTAELIQPQLRDEKTEGDTDPRRPTSSTGSSIAVPQIFV